MLMRVPMIMTVACSECAVRDQALCGSLTDTELVALNSISQRRQVSAGETIMWAGDESLNCANIVSGVLKMVASTADGREQIVGLLHAADFVGAPYAEQIDFTTTALTDAVLCVFPRKPFERVVGGSRAIGALAAPTDAQGAERRAQPYADTCPQIGRRKGCRAVARHGGPRWIERVPSRVRRAPSRSTCHCREARWRTSWVSPSRQ